MDRKRPARLKSTSEDKQSVLLCTRYAEVLQLRRMIAQHISRVAHTGLSPINDRNRMPPVMEIRSRKLLKPMR